jgi:hypothetical protein
VKGGGAMSRFTHISGIVVLAGVACLLQTVEPSPARGAEGMSESDFELMRSDIRTKKGALIADRMKFTDREAAAFWPVYRQYEADLAAINDKKVSIMKDYLSRHDALTGQQADQLAQDVFDVDQKTLDLRVKCFGALKKAIPTKTIVRWLQLERRLQLLIDAQLAKDLPVIQP